MKATQHTRLYAANLVLANVRALVIGGGEVALRKTRSLLDARADVTVVAPEFHASFAPLRKAGKLRLRRRAFRAADLRSARVVFAATHDPALNARIAKAAQKKGLLVNVAAPPEAGNFQVPASIRRGRVSIAVSTGGTSAALARALREHIEKSVGAEWEALAGLLEARRARLLKKMSDAGARHGLLCELGSARWARLIKQRGAKAAARKMDARIAAALKAGSRNGAGRAHTRKRT